MSLSKTLRNIIRSLNSRMVRLAGDTKEKATELRDLYEQRKIAQFSAASTIIDGCINATTPKEKRATKCNDVIQNNRINLPLNVRMKRSTVTNIVKQSKANDESWTLDVMLYREGVREGDNKRPSFTIKVPIPISESVRELKYYPITKDGKERTYTVNTSTNIDEYVGKRILKINHHDLFRKFIVTLAQDPEFKTTLNVMGGYVGVDQKTQSRSTRRGKPRRLTLLFTT